MPDFSKICQSSANLSSNAITGQIPNKNTANKSPITGGDVNAGGSYQGMTGGEVSVNGGTFAIPSSYAVSGGEISNGAGSTTLLATVSGGEVASAGQMVIGLVSGGTVDATFTGANTQVTGTYGTVIDSVTGGTVRGSGTYTINNMSGGTLNGTDGGKFYIDVVSGGTLRNGIFYTNTITGSPSTSNATVVVNANASFSGGDAPSFNGPTGTPSSASPNLGIAITSPTADPSKTVEKYSMGGSTTMTMVGAMYFPVDTSTVSLRGLSSSCAEIISSVVNLNGNVSLSRNNCSLDPITGAVAGYPVIVE